MLKRPRKPNSRYADYVCNDLVDVDDGDSCKSSKRGRKPAKSKVVTALAEDGCTKAVEAPKVTDLESERDVVETLSTLSAGLPVSAPVVAAAPNPVQSVVPSATSSTAHPADAVAVVTVAAPVARVRDEDAPLTTLGMPDRVFGILPTMYGTCYTYVMGEVSADYRERILGMIAKGGFDPAAFPNQPVVDTTYCGELRMRYRTMQIKTAEFPLIEWCCHAMVPSAVKTCTCPINDTGVDRTLLVTRMQTIMYRVILEEIHPASNVSFARGMPSNLRCYKVSIALDESDGIATVIVTLPCDYMAEAFAKQAMKEAIAIMRRDSGLTGVLARKAATDPMDFVTFFVSGQIPLP